MLRERAEERVGEGQGLALPLPGAPPAPRLPPRDGLGLAEREAGREALGLGVMLVEAQGLGVGVGEGQWEGEREGLPLALGLARGEALPEGLPVEFRPGLRLPQRPLLAEGEPVAVAPPSAPVGVAHRVVVGLERAEREGL